MAFYDQSKFDIRCEWGIESLKALAPVSDVVVIVDVLSFSTAVDVAVGQGAYVFPYRWKDESALDFARSVGAELADPSRKLDSWSLSPASLVSIPRGTRLVLPSPNGSNLSLACGRLPTFGGIDSKRESHRRGDTGQWQAHIDRCGRRAVAGWNNAPSRW